MKVRPEDMSRDELVKRLHELEARLRDDRERQVLLHDLRTHQEELEAQQVQLIETQGALEAVRDRYADLFELAPLGYVTLDRDGIIEEINAAGLLLLGIRDRHVAQGPFSLFIAHEDRPAFHSHLRILESAAERSQTEVRLRARSGQETRYVQAYSRRWAERETGQTRYLTALLDVTERRRAEEDRRNTEVARRELAEEERAMHAANQAKDRFLAALSHELRTPLTPIMLALDVLAERHDLLPDVKSTLRMVRRNVDQEARLIDDLLDVTRIAHDKLHCERSILDLHGVLRDVYALFKDEARAAGLTLTIDLAAEAAFVLGDSVRLRQVVSNLLRNAFRHTPANGRIALRSETPAPGRIRVTVADTGHGIPRALLARIFLPFEQADPAHGVGLGLGLAIAKGLIEQHAGTITAESEVGAGAILTIELPTVEPFLSERAPEPAVAGPAGHDITVLVVEDHADSAEALELGLTAAGYRVMVADSVRNALAKAERPFDILVSDLGLPDGSGFDIMRTLVRRRPVIGIALSGFGAASDVRESRDAGFQRHLVKPVDLSKLIETIEALVPPRTGLSA